MKVWTSRRDERSLADRTSVESRSAAGPRSMASALSEAKRRMDATSGERGAGKGAQPLSPPQRWRNRSVKHSDTSPYQLRRYDRHDGSRRKGNRGDSVFK